MRRLIWMLLGMVLGGGLMWGTFTYHVVRTPGGLTWVPKYQPTLAETYLDIRNWNAAEWRSHPDFVRSLRHHGRTDLLIPAVESHVRNLLED